MTASSPNNTGRRIACTRRKEGGTCDNARTYLLAPIEERVIAGLKQQLADPRQIAAAVATYNAERRRLAKEGAGKRETFERQLANATREIDRIVDAIARGTITEREAAARLGEARRRQSEAEAGLAALTARRKTVALHPTATARYLEAIEKLGDTLREFMGNAEIMDPLRELVGAVVVKPGVDSRGAADVTITGRLAALIGEPMPPDGDIPRMVVAGAGIEPATYGLIPPFHLDIARKFRFMLHVCHI
jgi:site-specific DNA recombinase